MGSAAVAAGQSNPPTPGGVRRGGVKKGTRFVGIYLVYSRLMVIGGPGLGAESVPNRLRGVVIFRRHMQSNSILFGKNALSM